MKILLGFIFVVTFVLGCAQSNETNDNNDMEEHLSSVVRQSVTAKTTSSVSFLTRASWGSSCGSFSRSEVVITDTIVLIKVYGKQPKDAVCLAVMITFEAPVTVNIPLARTYTFKLWQSDSSSIDTTFSVP